MHVYRVSRTILALVVCLAAIADGDAAADCQCRNSAGEPATATEFSSPYGGCLPRSRCESFFSSLNVRSCICEVSPDGQRCESKCEFRSDPCRENSATSCPQKVEISNDTCIEERDAGGVLTCRVQTQNVEVQCRAANDDGRPGVRVTNRCKSAKVLETGAEVCGGTCDSSRWVPDEVSPEKCRLEDGGLGSMPLLPEQNTFHCGAQ